MSYTPPAGNAIVCDFQGGYIPPAGNAVVLEFGAGGGQTGLAGLAAASALAQATLSVRRSLAAAAAGISLLTGTLVTPIPLPLVCTTASRSRLSVGLPVRRPMTGVSVGRSTASAKLY
jgi:hypothetical protein